MLPLSNFSFTMLAIAVILVFANAPLLPIYIVCGIGAVWQFLIAIYAGPPQPVEPDIPEDPADGIPVD